MKFNKRLHSESIEEWRDLYLDYKGLKGGIKHDDPSTFDVLLSSELSKVNDFTTSMVGALGDRFQVVAGAIYAPPGALSIRVEQHAVVAMHCDN